MNSVKLKMFLYCLTYFERAIVPLQNLLMVLVDKPMLGSKNIFKRPKMSARVVQKFEFLHNVIIIINFIQKHSKDRPLNIESVVL